MKNVLFIHSSSELYGSDRSLLYIIKNLDKSKYNVYVILPYHGPLVNEMRELDNVHIEIFKVAVLRRKNLSFIGAISYFRDFIFSVSYLKKSIRKLILLIQILQLCFQELSLQSTVKLKIYGT